MQNTRNHYREDILENYVLYDKVLYDVTNKYGYNSYIHIMIESARLHYATGHNKKSGYFFVFVRILKVLAVSFLTKSNLTSVDRKKVILSYRYFEEDKVVSRLTKIPLSYVRRKKSFNTNGLSVVKNSVKLFFILLTYRDIVSISKYLYYVPQMIYALSVYLDIEFGMIKSIIIASDSDFICYAVIVKANQLGLKTTKIDHFLINNVMHNKIYCKTYYCPNIYCLGLLTRFNPNTHFVIGGYPRFDLIKGYEKVGSKDYGKCKIITYFTQHSLLSNEQLLYLMDLIDIISNNDGFRLVIKVHKYDNNDYSQYVTSNISVLQGSQIDNYQLIADSDYTFSIASTLSMEAKLICENSYLIQYNSEFDYGVIDYRYFGKIINIIKNKDMLIEVIMGRFKPIGTKHFIDNFNPSYPDTCLKLIEFS